MRHRYLASASLVLLLAAPAAAQTPPPAPPGTEKAQPAPGGTPAPSANPVAQAPSAPGGNPAPSTEPAPPPPPPAVPPGTGQPAPPAPPAESAKAAAAPSPGQIISKWSATIYGFAEVDIMRDSTQSFTDSPGNGLVVRRDGPALTYNNGRTQTTARNSRFGVRLSAPEFNRMKASGNIELDFMGNQPAVSEASFVNNGTFRIRAAYARLETEYVDVLAGQSYFLFGHGPFFFPMSIWFFGMPNQAFGRTQQFRLSRLFKTPEVNVDLGVSAQRPPQRDAEWPDLQAGVKVGVNAWKGVHTIGSGYPSVDPLTVGVSGSWRHFAVTEFSPSPTMLNRMTGWGVSLDAMIPIIPRPSSKEKANALTATGSFVIGNGIGDLLGGLSGGASFPSLPPAMPGGPSPTFTPNIDGGMVQYDSDGNLRTIDWRTFMVGLQYYVPPSGNLTIGANYTRGDSDNITDGLSETAMRNVITKSQFFELVALGDITPAVRAGVAWQRIEQTRGDNQHPKNNRIELSVFFFF
jgi:predicted porin